MQVIDEDGNEIYTASLKFSNKSQLIRPDFFYKNILLKENLGFSLSPSTIYKKDILKKYDLFNKDLKGYCDTFFINSVCLTYNSFYINNVCSYWLLEKDSISQSSSMLDSFKIFYHSSKLMIFSKKYKNIYPKYYIIKWISLYPFKIILRPFKKMLNL